VVVRKLISLESRGDVTGGQKTSSKNVASVSGKFETSSYNSYEWKGSEMAPFFKKIKHI